MIKSKLFLSVVLIATAMHFNNPLHGGINCADKSQWTATSTPSKNWNLSKKIISQTPNPEPVPNWGPWILQSISLGRHYYKRTAPATTVTFTYEVTVTEDFEFECDGKLEWRTVSKFTEFDKKVTLTHTDTKEEWSGGGGGGGGDDDDDDGGGGGDGGDGGGDATEPGGDPTEPEFSDDYTLGGIIDSWLKSFAQELDPLDISKGNFHTIETDMVVNSIRKINFTRSYDSSQNINTSLGHNWRHNFSSKLEFQPPTQIRLVDNRFVENDITITRTFVNKSGPYDDASPSALYTSPSGCHEVLTKAGDIYIMENKQTGTKVYFDSQGRVSKECDRNNVYLYYTYDAYSNLVAVKDSHGRGFDFEYTQGGALQFIRDSSATREVTYQISTSNNLTRVTYPTVNGKTPVKQYDYDDNNNLNKSSNKKGAYYVESVYDENNRVVNQTFGNGTGSVSYKTKIRRVDDLGRKLIQSHTEGGIETFAFGSRDFADPDTHGNCFYTDAGHFAGTVDPHLATPCPSPMDCRVGVQHSIINPYGPGPVSYISINSMRPAFTSSGRVIRGQTHRFEATKGGTGGSVDIIFKGLMATQAMDVIKVDFREHVEGYKDCPIGPAPTFTSSSVCYRINGRGYWFNFGATGYQNELRIDAECVESGLGYFPPFEYRGSIRMYAVFPSLELSGSGSFTSFYPMDSENGPPIVEKTVNFAGKRVRFLNRASTLAPYSEMESTYTAGIHFSYNHSLRQITISGARILDEQTINLDDYDNSKQLVVILDGYGGFLIAEEEFEGPSKYISEATVTDWENFDKVYTFDEMGQTTSVKSYSKDKSHSFTTSYEYDKAGHITKLTSPEGKVVTYTYNDMGKVTEERKHFSGDTISENDLVTTMTYVTEYSSLKTSTDSLGNVTTFYYDFEEATLGDLNGDAITTQGAGNLIKVDAPLVDTDGDGIADTHPTIVTQYNTNGQVVKTIDALGHETVYSYFSGGDFIGLLESKTVDPSNLNIVTSYTYDVNGRPETITDPKGNITSYKWDDLDHLVEVRSDQERIGVYMEYDEDGNKTKMEIDYLDENYTIIGDGRITQSHVYDLLSRKTQSAQEITDGTFGNVFYAYDLNSNISTITNDAQQVVKYGGYDHENRATSVSSGFGSADETTSTKTYDADGNLLTATSAEDKMVEMECDEFGRIYRTYDHDRNYVVNTYDANSNIVMAQMYDNEDLLLSEESSIYDALNRQTSTSKKLWGTVNGVEVPYESAIVLTSSFEYDLNDNLIKSIGNNGEITVFEYDDASRLEAKKVFKGSLLITKTVHIMDNNGNVLTVTNSTFAEDGSETVMSTVTSTYDSFNRLKTQTDANNNAAEMFYDSRGKVVKTVNAKNQVQLSEYNLLGQAVKSINEVGADVAATNGEVVTTREYDNLGKHIADVDDKGNRTEYEYDDLNRMVNKINPDDSFTSLAYNNDSQVVTTTDENGTVVTFTYDSQGGVDTKTITRVTGVEGVVGVVMTYDSQGRLLTAENYDENDQLVSKVGRKYNSLGELVEETQQIGTAPAKIVSYAINHATNEQTITYPSGKTVTYDRDQVNRLNSVVLGSVGGLPEDEVTVASYDYVGVRRSGMTLGNNVVQTYAYGDAGELVTIDNKLADSTILGLEYGYDELYNRLYEKRTTGTDSESDLFAYDSLNRLIKARYSETGIVPQFYDWTTDVAADKHDITLDTVHNRTGETLDGDLTSYISNDLNQYTAITGNINGTSSPTYDTVGNTTLYNGFDLAYDYQNRLVRVENSQQKINFLYDVSGRRVQKTLFEKGDGVTAPLADWVESTKTQYVYSGSEVIEEYDYSISTTNYALAKTYILGESVDQPIALILEPNATRQTPEVYYYHTNIQQSVMAMTDENGAVVERYSYDISGKQTVYDALGQTISIPQSSIGNQYGFTGRRIDVETGLMYFRARYYSPEQGRFISKDPLGFVDGMNSYAGYFAMFGMIDPSGMEARAAIASATWEGFKEGFTGSLKNQWDFAKEATGDTINYIKNNVDDSTWTQAAGVLNAVGGVVETFVGAGVTAGSGGLGSVIGIGIMAHGVDNVQAGIRQAWTGEEVDTGTSIGLQAAGLSRGTANLVDAGISIVATLGGGAYLRAARHSLVEVTSWVPIGITPDLNSGRWVVKGAATRFNFFRTALWGPTSSNLKNFKTMKNFKAITGFVPRSRLSFPKFHWKNEPLPLIKVFFGQWQLK